MFEGRINDDYRRRSVPSRRNGGVWTRLADEQNIRAQQQKDQSKKDHKGAASSGKANEALPQTDEACILSIT